MNIGIDIRKIRDYGIGSHIRNVILPAVHSMSDCRFYLYCAPEDREGNQTNVSYIEETTSKYSIREHFSLAAKASRAKIDLFHSPHFTLPLMLKCKTIVTIHDLIHLKFPQFFASWKVSLGKMLLKTVVRKADLILTVSETSKRDILEFFPAAQKKVEVVYNRISEDWFRLPVAPVVGGYGIKPGYLLYCGSFKKHKGLRTLMDAYSRLKQKPDLVLVGNRTADDAGVPNELFSIPGVRMFGFAGREMLQNLYSQAMLFVFPSLYEGFGYPPLEAMAGGCPVLSSDAPALKEVLGEAAAYFESGDAESLQTALVSLIDDSARRGAMKQAGFERSRMFATDSSSIRLKAIYRSFQ